MSYIDGFLLAVPEKNRAAYLKMAKDCAPVFKEHGAVSMAECWGNDVPDGTVTSFPMAVKKKDDEAVVFSWIMWPSRGVRDKGMEAAMKDPRLAAYMQPENIPFDGQRMIFGGFEVIYQS